MKNMIDNIINKLNELYKVYEEYCWQDDDSRIMILFQDECISFYLSKNEKNKDEFCLSFSKIEKRIYEYVALKVFNMVIGDVYIYKDGNNFYNTSHKPYLSIVVNDERLLVFINELVFNQEMIFIDKNIDNIYRKKPFKLYNAKFLKQIDNRLDASKKLLRSNK